MSRSYSRALPLRNGVYLFAAYNILCRNKPNRKSKIYMKWDYLESITYEELLDENENVKECNKIIDEIIEFLKEQKLEVLK